MNPLVRPWRHVFDFSGRATRTEYGLFHLSAFVAYIVLGVLPITMLDVRGGRAGDPEVAAITIIAVMALLSLALMITALIGHISIAIRRLHDHGEPGIKYLMTFIPFIGFIFWLMLMLTRGDDYDNDYGPDPRQPEQDSVEALGSVFS
ncbi:DUF805 domain-containing protein [soil metagenome]